MLTKVAYYYLLLLTVSAPLTCHAKSDKDDGDLDDIPFDTSCGSNRAGGCAVATGQQVIPTNTIVNDNSDAIVASFTAYGRFAFQFDPTFSEMEYTTEVFDPEQQPTTRDVLGFYLVCSKAGSFVGTCAIGDADSTGCTDGTFGANLFAELDFDPDGSLEQGTIRELNDAATNIADCNPEFNTDVASGDIPRNNVATLWSAMRKGLVAVMVKTEGIGGIRWARAQIFIPQDGYTY